jgi:hypothetical protein
MQRFHAFPLMNGPRIDSPLAIIHHSNIRVFVPSFVDGLMHLPNISLSIDFS